MGEALAREGTLMLHLKSNYFPYAKNLLFFFSVKDQRKFAGLLWGNINAFSETTRYHSQKPFPILHPYP